MEKHLHDLLDPSTLRSLTEIAVAHKVSVFDLVSACLRRRCSSDALHASCKVPQEIVAAITSWPHACRFCKLLCDVLAKCIHCGAAGCATCIPFKGCCKCVGARLAQGKANREQSEKARS